MSFPQARMTDLHTCLPPMLPAPTPILPPCALTVMVNMLPAARMGDMAVGAPAPPAPPAPVPHPFVKGSMTVMIMSQPALRMGVDPCSFGGMVVFASLNVMTGG
ncbi:MAG: PAAR domain-containing protein [Rhodobacteraceae bacterium]|nr:PAAR domain-containing protein [Paracoccaceae bacterium]